MVFDFGRKTISKETCGQSVILLKRMTDRLTGKKIQHKLPINDTLILYGYLKMIKRVYNSIDKILQFIFLIAINLFNINPCPPRNAVYSCTA